MQGRLQVRLRQRQVALNNRALPIDDVLLRAVLAGDARAARTFLGLVAPRIEQIARAHPSLRRRGLARLEDDIAELRTSTLERLAHDGYQNLAQYLAQRGDTHAAPSHFDLWLRGAVDFAVREHLRRRYGRAPSVSAKEQGPQLSKRDVGTLADRLDGGEGERLLQRTLGATGRLTAKALLDYMAEHFAPDETQAMRMFYVEDQSLAEIARVLGLENERAADKLLRKLNARLRYKFARDQAGD